MAKPRILVTGGTGHIGFRTLVLALEAGYHVHVVTRSEKQWAKIRNAPSVRPYAQDVTFFAVPDMTAEDAYEEAIRGTEGVIHIASPIPNPDNYTRNKSWQETFYDPARRGTLAMLRAAAKTPSVDRVVVTSSISVLEPPAGREFAGPYDIKPAPDLATANQISNGLEAYGVSKVFAHTAADDFVRTNKVHFDLVRVLPGGTQGANELVQTREEMVKGTNRLLIAAAGGVTLDESESALTGQVLLEDVARAHILALKPDVAKHGENLIIAGNGGVGIPWDVIGKEVARQFPEDVKKGELKPVTEGRDDWIITKFDVEASEKAVGFKFAGASEMVRSVVTQWLALHVI